MSENVNTACKSLKKEKPGPNSKPPEGIFCLLTNCKDAKEKRERSENKNRGAGFRQTTPDPHENTH